MVSHAFEFIYVQYNSNSVTDTFGKMRFLCELTNCFNWISNILCDLWNSSTSQHITSQQVVYIEMLRKAITWDQTSTDSALYQALIEIYRANWRAPNEKSTKFKVAMSIINENLPNVDFSLRRNNYWVWRKKPKKLNSLTSSSFKLDLYWWWWCYFVLNTNDNCCD